MKRLNPIIYIILTLLSTNSCMNDNSLWDETDYRFQANGLFVVCEGNFMYNNASLTYYDIEKQEAFTDVFFHSNGKLPLGDVAQSMAIRDSLGYVVINNSGKIYIINTNTFKLEGKITGLVSPRYIHFIDSSKAYVTDLYARSISIINPVTQTVTGNIITRNTQSNFNQHPTEQMVQYGKYVFTNCWSYDNKILIIDSELDSIVDSITVPIQPKSMIMDRFDKLWVLTDGGFEGSHYGHEKPTLLRIDAETRAIERTFEFELDDFPSSLALNSAKDTLYFVNRHIYRHPVFLDRAPEVFITSPYSGSLFGGYSAVAVDPYTSHLYVADAKDNSQPGIVYRFDTEAMPVDSFKTGIIPNSFCFANK